MAHFRFLITPTYQVAQTVMFQYKRKVWKIEEISFYLKFFCNCIKQNGDHVGSLCVPLPHKSHSKYVVGSCLDQHKSKDTKAFFVFFYNSVITTKFPDFTKYLTELLIGKCRRWRQNTHKCKGSCSSSSKTKVKVLFCKMLPRIPFLKKTLVLGNFSDFALFSS